MYRLNIWNDSFNQLRSLAAAEKFNPFFETEERDEKAYYPPCDIEETDSHYLMSFDVPGMSKKDIQIEVKGTELHVSGERKFERKEKATLERSFGKFYRTFTLPENVNTEGIEAQCENGVLVLAVPKPEAVKPRQIKIGEGKTSFFSRLISTKEDPKGSDASKTSETVA